MTWWGKHLINADNLTADEDEYYDYLEYHVYPTELETLSIPVFVVLFLCGLFGNALVIFVVLRNHQMRTITNIFLVNLAIADFLVILICLPVSVIVDITSTWFFGSVLCQLTATLQTTTVSVSVLTLTAISVERWYAIVRPMTVFRKTINRTLLIILGIWLLSITVSLVDGLNLQIVPGNFDITRNISTIWFTTCSPRDQLRGNCFKIVIIILLYVVPLCFMAVCYGQIANHLWQRNHILRESEVAVPDRRSQGAVSQQMLKQRSITKQRRRTAKMLISIVFIFATCFLPINILFIMESACRSCLDTIPPNMSDLITLISRLVLYGNSCINPIIYNFMSENFKREYRRAICCCSNSYNINDNQFTNIQTQVFNRHSVTNHNATVNNRATITANEVQIQKMETIVEANHDQSDLLDDSKDL